MMKVMGAYTPICEEDAGYIDQYLSEVERLDVPFALYLDRCSPKTKRKITGHRLCLGSVANNDPGKEFSEKDRQGPFDLIAAAGLRWAVSWDMDETYEKAAPEKLAGYLAGSDAACLAVNVVTLWGDAEHIRTDIGGPQPKIYDVSKFTWKFLSGVTNGPRAVTPTPIHPRGWQYEDCLPLEQVPVVSIPVVCLHWGLITRELRLFHKARWDRIYSNPGTGGGNPYQSWNMALDEAGYPPVVERHHLL